MVKTGLTWVRIGEFAWSRLEPQPGQYDWTWLDRAINILGTAGLQVVLGTPTATPPRWLVDQEPDMLAVDIEGRVRKFGARDTIVSAISVTASTAPVSSQSWPSAMGQTGILRHGKPIMNTGATTQQLAIQPPPAALFRYGYAAAILGPAMTAISRR